MSAALSVATPASAAAATYMPIDSDGPLEHIAISNELNCQVIHTADAQAQFYPSVDLDHGACGTQLRVGATTYGPSDVPGGNDPTDFVPVSQSAVTGIGTSTQPYKIVTVVQAGDIKITQTDSYVEGKEDYRTDVTLKNISTTTTHPVVLYRYGDCYLHEDDQGYGRVVGTAGIACTTSNEPDAGTLTFSPVTAGSKYYEGAFGPLYNFISAGTAFPSTCDCTSLTENAAGLSWTKSLAKGASATYSHTTKISPLGPSALTTTKTVAKADAVNGSQVTYSIKVKNPTSVQQTLTQVTDLLPSTFSYVSGSTTGITTANPTVAANGRLIWDVSRAIAAGGTATLGFRAVANGTAGALHYNRAGGAGSIRVAPTGPTAPVRICTFVDTAGGHTITGTAGNDVICAGDVDDTIDALEGADIVMAGSGNDSVNGGPGNDALDGGTGNDTQNGGPGADVFVGGGGVDTVFYGPGVGAQLLIDLNNNGALDGASGEKDDVRSDIENAVGGDASDKIIGNSLANLLQGGGGGDVISGKGKVDQLRGGAGYDELKGNDDSTTADSLDCGADRGKAFPGTNDTTANCDL